MYNKLKVLFTNRFDYIVMRLISRVYILRKLSFFINRLKYKKSLEVSNPNDTAVKLSSGASVNDIIKDLNDNGISLKLKLDKKYLKNILNFANNTPCYAYGDPKIGFFLDEIKQCEKSINKEILLAKYFNYQKQKPFVNLINSPLLQRIADAYLGKNAKNIATQLWWTFPANVDPETKSEAAHYFHRDVDAWGFVKFFFYLNDVMKDGGPHVYVKKSHKPSFLTQFFYEKFLLNRHSDSSARNKFGDKAIYPIYGSAGTAIAADTFGLHKGESPKKRPRLLLCCVYANKDYGVQDFLKNPETLSHFRVAAPKSILNF